MRDTNQDAATFQWPGVNSSETKSARMIHTRGKIKTQKQTKWVRVKIGNIPQRLYTDTGSEYTIIPPNLYNPDMGEVVAADTYLRAWGSNTNLDVKGMIYTTMQNQKGATTNQPRS